MPAGPRRTPYYRVRAMEERVYIQWTVVNWITIFLMATIGFLMVGAIAQAAQKITGNSGGAAPSDG